MLYEAVLDLVQEKLDECTRQLKAVPEAEDRAKVMQMVCAEFEFQTNEIPQAIRSCRELSLREEALSMARLRAGKTKHFARLVCISNKPLVFEAFQRMFVR